MFSNKVQLNYSVYLFTVDRLYKKFNQRAAKYTVTKVISPYSVRLNTPRSIHDVFYVDRLRLAATNLLPSQLQDNSQPDPIIVNREEEYKVKEIVAEKCCRRGRGTQLLYKVKQKGYKLTTQELVIDLKETVALKRWINYSRLSRGAKTGLLKGFQRTISSLEQGDNVRNKILQVT